MAMNTSGAISLAGSTAGVSIAQQLGLGTTTQISLNDSAVRTLAGVPSGAIVMPTNFYGKSNSVTINLTIASNTKNYNIFSNKGGSYVAGKSIINLTINSGVVVGSTSTSTYAMDTGSGWATGDVINITNNGYIAGHGGAGGYYLSLPGKSGGSSMNLQWNITAFTNSSGYVYSTLTNSTSPTLVLEPRQQRNASTPESCDLNAGNESKSAICKIVSFGQKFCCYHSGNTLLHSKITSDTRLSCITHSATSLPIAPDAPISAMRSLGTLSDSSTI